MRSATRKLFFAVALFVTPIICISGAWAQKSITGIQDISGLFATAEKRFDLSKEDAIILFDGKKIHWLPDGRLSTFIHRIIWINTDVARRNYGDHRIAYDDAHCTFNVITVRTWRDWQWWETDTTGIVETLPFELEDAHDYTNMREMMLLHNGIEFPCILEIAYSIEDKQPFRKGTEGLWTLAREEPTVRSRFTYGLPIGRKPNLFTSEDVPAPEKETIERLGLDIYRWEMGPLDAIPRPHTDDPAADVPHIAWSTWENWGEFGNCIDSSFAAVMILDETLERSLDSLIVDARTDTERAGLIADFIDDRTRFIRYPGYNWRQLPRPASQTYSTAYGHRLDRAVLAAAMFNESGIETHPVFMGKGYGAVDEGVPTLSRMIGIGVWILGDDLEAYYDPESGTVSNGIAPIYGRTVWLPGLEDKPNVPFGGEKERGFIDVRINLAFDGEKDRFTGSGYLYADNCFNPYHRMVGLKKEAKTYLGTVVSSLIEGAEVTDFNPSGFDRSRVIFGFELELKKPEPDDLGRLQLTTGEPSGGIFDRLPDDVRLFHQERSSPIYLPCLMSQKIELKLDLKGLDVIYFPIDQTVENDAGSFACTATQEGGRIVLTRTLYLAKRVYRPEKWPLLRTLLLADQHDRNQTLLVKAEESAGGNQDKKNIDKR
ncbi:MAG: DUF3857 domain-containing protein [Desulfobacteraceae bacterium]|nr:DUF3857 domain-containing protein [Desulfobacteraceae bacterium]